MGTSSISAYIVTLFFTVVIIAMLVMFNWPGAWRRLKDGDVGLLIQLNQRTSVVFKKTPIVHAWFPLQKVRIYSELPIRVDMKPVTLMTGGQHPASITINNPGFTMAIVNPERAYWDTPKHDPGAQLLAIAADAMTQFTAKTDVTDFTRENGALRMKEEVMAALQEKADEHGAKVIDFWVNDIDLPASLEEATDIRNISDAKAYETRVSSEAEVEAFKRQRAEQGALYLPLELMDRLGSMVRDAARAGLRVFGGDAQAMMQMLVTLGLEQQEASHGSTAKKRSE